MRENRFVAIGRAATKPTIFPNKKPYLAVAKFSLCVDDGKYRHFIDCQARGKWCDFVKKYVHKGTPIYIENSQLQTYARTIKKDGVEFTYKSTIVDISCIQICTFKLPDRMGSDIEMQEIEDYRKSRGLDSEDEAVDSILPGALLDE